MAITRIKSTGKVGTSGTSIPMSFGSLPVAGNFIGVLVWAYDATGTLDFQTDDCTDNQGNTYVRAVQSASNAVGKIRCVIYYAMNIGTPSGTFTVTVAPTTGAGSYFVGVATEWSGMATSDALDQSTSATGTSAFPSTGTTATTTQADELVLALCDINAAQTSLTIDVTDPPWTEEAEELTFTYQPGEADSRIISSTGTQVIGWNGTGSSPWVAAIATFKASTAASPLNLTITDGVLQTTPF